MAKAKSHSFIAELPLIVQSNDDRVMAGRLEAGRRLYNAVLSEALKRLARMRQSKAYQAARLLPKGKARSDAFNACNTQFGFSEYALQAIATQHKNSAGFADRLGAHETQKIATRVWSAIQEYVFGSRGKPRFKGRNRPLHSLEGKSNAAGIRWNRETGCVTWSGLALPAKLPTQQQDPYLTEALKAKTKYCRIVWRTVKDQRRWFVQLVQEGQAPAKYAFHASGQVVGLDVGPSTIAIVGDEAVGLEPFAPSVVQPWKASRRLQRALDRSRRATNPDNYEANGTVKKGAKKWHQSARYKRLSAELAETERRLAETRIKEHGHLANRILGLGNVIQTETLSYKAFQKNYGRSVKVRAPGAFITLLSRKAESAGGKLVELNTRKLRMSQYDHITGTCTKKPLKQRWHRLEGSSRLVQRDMYSAFLAKHASEAGHNPRQLEQGWPVAEPLLARAGLCFNESASGMPSGSPTVLLPSEQIARERRWVRGHVRNVVSRKAESPETPACQCLWNPLPLGMGRFTVNGRVVNIGSFKTAEEAHEAYRHAKRDTHTHGMLVPRTTEPPNKLKKRKSSTGHTGVEFRSGRYRAFFHADRRTKINVGSFHTAEDAIEARRVAMEMGAEAWIEFSSGQAASKTNSTRGSKSGFVGVHKVSGKDWYEAYFDHDGKRYFVGGFDTAEAASVARQKAKADHYSRKMDGKQP